MQPMPGHELKRRPHIFSEGNGETSQHHSWQLPQHQVMDNPRQRFVALGSQTLCAVSFAIAFDFEIKFTGGDINAYRHILTTLYRARHPHIYANKLVDNENKTSESQAL